MLNVASLCLHSAKRITVRSKLVSRREGGSRLHCRRLLSRCRGASFDSTLEFSVLIDGCGRAVNQTLEDACGRRLSHRSRWKLIQLVGLLVGGRGPCWKYPVSSERGTSTNCSYFVGPWGCKFEGFLGVSSQTQVCAICRWYPDTEVSPERATDQYLMCT